MKTLKYLTATFLLISGLLSGGCGSSRKIVTPLTIPDFSYSPPVPEAPGSAGIKIALFEPVYPGNFAYSSKSPFNKFRVSMGKDLEQIMTARGYVIKGPYEQYDLMTYSDKEECELGLFADIDLNIARTSGGWRQQPPNPAWGIGVKNVKGYAEFQGTVTLSGKITLYISETFTRQKLIVKSLPIPQQIDIPVTAESFYQYGVNPESIPLDDPGVHNPIAAALVDFYKSTMKRAWDLIPKEDLLRAKSQVANIRRDAGFIKN